MTRRADAALNDERIVIAALRELAADPGAAMERVASAAGVGRATLYRRFPTRDDLLEGLRERARRDARRAIAAARPDEGSAAEALERIVRALIPVADRYAYLAQLTPARRAPEQAAQAKPVLAVIRRGQAAGELCAELPPEWWLAALRTHVQQAAATVAAGMPLDEAARLATRALLRGLRA